MRGILMIEPLYKQTILGLKTQTRRSSGLEIVNGVDKKTYGPQPGPDFYRFTSPVVTLSEVALAAQNKPHKIMAGFTGDYAGSRIHCKPRYKIGEILFLKEPYIGQNGQYSYMYGLKENSPLRKSIKWKNKMFMPADAGRIFIKITNVKCERLMDISVADCLREGIERDYDNNEVFKNYLYQRKGYLQFVSDAKTSFISLYKFANKVKEVPNIWVFAYSFELFYNNSYEQD